MPVPWAGLVFGLPRCGGAGLVFGQVAQARDGFDDLPGFAGEGVVVFLGLLAVDPGLVEVSLEGVDLVEEMAEGFDLLG